MVRDFPEPREGQDPLYDGFTGERCFECDRELYDGQLVGVDNMDHYICFDCIEKKYERQSDVLKILQMGYDAVYLHRPTRMLHR